ncbi:MAG: hypothetical protein MR853_05140 [Selenomonadales bacterium]|nr:hypothetical protein [Selenomonadales bacterium]
MSEQHPGWNNLLRMYCQQPEVRQVILVQHIENSRARVQLYVKTDEYPDFWTKLLTCDAYVGRNGLGKTMEGDMKSPAGDFGVITAVGMKDNPGTKAEYLKLDEHIFCADGPYYNKLVDDREIPREEILKYNGDHMNDTSPQFNYGLFLDYNKECIPGKGSYIFMHCDGPSPFTAGCVAVSEENMKFILQHVDNNVRICIFPMYQ